MTKRTMLYILSPSYSGSTLLTFLLSKHPQIATIGELKATGMGYVDEYRCSCGELIRECDFWEVMADGCRERGLEFSVETFDTKLKSNSRLANKLVDTAVRGPVFEALRSVALGMLPGAQRTLDSSIRRNFEIGETVCDLQQKAVFLDSSKTPSRLRHLARSDLWELKVICLYRDGRGVSNSNRKHLKTNMRDAAARWAHDAREIALTKQQLRGADVVDIRYEELCKEPEQVLASITDAFGFRRMSLTGKTLKEGQHHILGNCMRLKSTSEIRFDESWRSELSDVELKDFSQVAGSLNAELGYE